MHAVFHWFGSSVVEIGQPVLQPLVIASLNSVSLEDGF